MFVLGVAHHEGDTVFRQHRTREKARKETGEDEAWKGHAQLLGRKTFSDRRRPGVSVQLSV
jgi:ketosteroid isomerase-like protein